MSQTEPTASESGQARENTHPEQPESPPKRRSKWLKGVVWTVGILVGLVAVLIVIGFLLPEQYNVERSIVIEAPPPEIHAQVADLKQWPKWTVWNKEKYPELEYSYEDDSIGKGAVQTWTDPKHGNGSLEITWANPYGGIQYTMTMDAFDHELKGDIRYTREGDKTRVTWTSRGELGNNPVMRWLGLTFDKAIGAEYEASLQRLKNVVEKQYAEKLKTKKQTDENDQPPQPGPDSKDAPQRKRPPLDGGRS